MSLLESNTTYKPFSYPWAVTYATEHERIHWIEDELELQTDVNHWKSGALSDVEKNHITQILRLFTQSDVAVGTNYLEYYIPKFKNNEIRAMLTAFRATRSRRTPGSLRSCWASVMTAGPNLGGSTSRYLYRSKRPLRPQLRMAVLGSARPQPNATGRTALLLPEAYAVTTVSVTMPRLTQSANCLVTLKSPKRHTSCGNS